MWLYFCVHVSLSLNCWFFFLSLWCSLNLICLPAPPVTSCDLFSIDNKICVVKKNQSFSSSADLLISSLLILCKFHNQLYHTRDPEPSIEFHLLFILIAILFILDIIFYSLNNYTVSDINIELFYYTSPKSMSDCKDLKIQYKKDSVWDVKHIEQYQDNWWINK